MASLRAQRLSNEIRDILAGYFQGGLLSDPRVESVTITGVRLSGDLQIAYVYYRVYPGADQTDAQAGLRHAGGFLRKQLAENLAIRRIPELKFFFDESIERGARVEELLQSVKDD